MPKDGIGKAISVPYSIFRRSIFQKKYKNLKIEKKLKFSVGIVSLALWYIFGNCSVNILIMLLAEWHLLLWVLAMVVVSLSRQVACSN
jgi:hypothetical protein